MIASGFTFPDKSQGRVARTARHNVKETPMFIKAVTSAGVALAMCLAGPARAQSANGMPWVKPNRKPAANMSPAPVVSIRRSTASAGTSWTSSAVTTRLPFSPRVTTANGQRPRTRATARLRSSSS